MPSGLLARVVAVCTLIFGVSIAHAQRRPVAVIELSGDQQSSKVAADLNPILNSHPELQPIADASMVVELNTYVEEDEQEIIEATAAKQNAENELNRFSLDFAQQSALSGQTKLQQVTPSGRVLTLYSQLAFLRGQALLGQQAKNAPTEFALAHRFDPGFVPDAARYLPDVVQAFEAAKTRWSGKATLQILGHGRLWIDGRETYAPQGAVAVAAPAEVEVDAGPHVVWLTGPDRVTSAKLVVVDGGKKAKVEIPDIPIDDKLKVQRARITLHKAPDAAARGVAMKQLAALLHVEDAILLSAANDRVIYQTWNAGKRGDQAPGFSSLREMRPTDKLGDLLKGLVPPKPKVEPPKTDNKTIIVDERRWYQRRPVQVTIGVSIVAAVIASYYIYKAATDDTVMFDNDIINAGRVRF